jgi:hypothetical protein
LLLRFWRVEDQGIPAYDPVCARIGGTQPLINSRDKWDTPDVIGKRESKRSDIIQAPVEIVSAGIKPDDCNSSRHSTKHVPNAFSVTRRISSFPILPKGRCWCRVRQSNGDAGR